MSNEQSSIPVGYVRRAHGIGGDVVVRGMVSDIDARLVEGAPLETGESKARHFTVASAKPHKGDHIVKLVDVDTRDAAEGLVGVQFLISIDDRRALDDGEWWPEDLIGCEVVGVDGSTIGTVADVVSGVVQDRLVIKPARGNSYEVPFVDELVPTVDTVQRQIFVDLPQGLSE